MALKRIALLVTLTLLLGASVIWASGIGIDLALNIGSGASGSGAVISNVILWDATGDAVLWDASGDAALWN